MPGKNHSGLFQNLLDFRLERLTFLVFCHREPKPPLSIHAVSAVVLGALDSHRTPSAYPNRIFGTTRFFPSVSTLSIGASTRRRLPALLERQSGRVRGKKTHPLNRSCCNTARPGWHNFHRVPRVRNRSVIVSPHFRDRTQAFGFCSSWTRGARSRSMA
jgi:hypothetical protein